MEAGTAARPAGERQANCVGQRSPGKHQPAGTAFLGQAGALDRGDHLMLTFWGSRQRLCDGLSRRDFLKVGALGVGGLTLADLLRLRAQNLARPGKSGKAIIMVYLNGGPSHIDLYDMKPNAPLEYRGDFKPIRTNVPGMDICELMPLQAK